MKRPSSTLMLLAALAASFAACSGEDSVNGGPAAGEGEACVDGYNCAAGLFCFVTTADPEAGVCTQPPSACNGDMDCQCLDELDAQCGSNSRSCMGFSGVFTVGCAPNDAARQLGDTCSSMVDCEAGLYCLSPAEGAVGTCKELPATCANDLGCDCFDGVCSGNTRCMIIGNKANIQCH